MKLMSDGLADPSQGVLFGVEVDGPTTVFCDNDSVVKNSTAPESTLKKKHNAICYHRVRESQVAGTCRVAKIKGTENLADPFTKVVVGRQRSYLFSRILW